MAEIEVFAGDSFKKNLVFRLKTVLTVIDITGCTIWFTIKENEDDDDEDALLQKKIDPPHSDPTNGTALLNCSITDMTITPGTYYFDFQYLSSGGVLTTLTKGKIKIKQGITDDNVAT